MYIVNIRFKKRKQKIDFTVQNSNCEISETQHNLSLLLFCRVLSCSYIILNKFYISSLLVLMTALLHHGKPYNMTADVTMISASGKCYITVVIVTLRLAWSPATQTPVILPDVIQRFRLLLTQVTFTPHTQSLRSAKVKLFNLIAAFAALTELRERPLPIDLIMWSNSPK